MPASSDLFLIVALAVLAAPLLISVRRRRDGIRYRLRKTIIVEGTYLGLVFVTLAIGQPPLVSILVGMVGGLIVSSRIKPRSRSIPASVKRAARAEFELRTGSKFNPKKHEYDHDVPFSRGGSHTFDNVRVVERTKNRSKGDTAPWWDLLGRW